MKLKVTDLDAFQVIAETKAKELKIVSKTFA